MLGLLVGETASYLEISKWRAKLAKQREVGNCFISGLKPSWKFVIGPKVVLFLPAMKTSRIKRANPCAGGQDCDEIWLRTLRLVLGKRVNMRSLSAKILLRLC